LPRLDQGRQISAAMQKAMQDDPSNIARRFWYDTIVYSEDALRFMAQTVGDRQIVVGSDYPFAIRQQQPAALAMRALGIGSPCLRDNAEALLGMTFESAGTREAAQ
jgi:aminocarboxymuconate-semialdehyde decarboxylase